MSESLDSPEDVLSSVSRPAAPRLQIFNAQEAMMTNGKSHGTTKETPKEDKKEEKAPDKK